MIIRSVARIIETQDKILEGLIIVSRFFVFSTAKKEDYNMAEELLKELAKSDAE